jgi:predicted hotdog family 3-hydroxylacyl-ACP dehydratase
MNPSEYDILTLLPQRPPFVFVDGLAYCDEKDATTRFRVKADCLLCDEGKLQPHGLMENIAQSCAARIGYLSLKKSGSVGIGLIGSVSDFEVVKLPKVGDEIETRITVDEEVFNFTLVSAQVLEASGSVVATARMKIALL